MNTGNLDDVYAVGERSQPGKGHPPNIVDLIGSDEGADIDFTVERLNLGREPVDFDILAAENGFDVAAYRAERDVEEGR